MNDQTRLVPAVASPKIVLSDSGVEAVAPAGNEPVEYVLSSASLSHSCPAVMLCVIAFVLGSYVVVLPVEVCNDWANCNPVNACSGTE